MRSTLAVLVAATLTVGAPAAAAPLQPTAKWIVDFDDAQCVATRNYGSDNNPIYLVLKAPPLGSVLQIGVIKRGSGSDARQINGELTFDQNPPLRTNLLQYGVQKLRQRAVLVNLPLQDLAPMRQATSLRIRAREDLRQIGTRINLGSDGVDVLFALTQMGPLLKTLDSCVDDLKKVWNVPSLEGGPSTLRQPVQGNLQGLVRPEDYPGIALEENQQGTVTFTLLVDETGRVADCTVIGTSGAASLDAQSCATVRARAKFTPAIGMDGKPAKASLIQRVNWRIEG